MEWRKNEADADDDDDGGTAVQKKTFQSASLPSTRKMGSKLVERKSLCVPSVNEFDGFFSLSGFSCRYVLRRTNHSQLCTLSGLLKSL